MNDLDREGQRLLTLLVEKLRDVIPGDPRTYISYRDVHEHLSLDLRGPTWGLSLRHQGLDSLANWTQATGKPGITGIIIERKPPVPGKGYFDLFRKDRTDIAWWEEQVRLSKQFDWSPFLPASVPPESPKASDINEPAERQKSTTCRIIRDTNLGKRVKLLHRCQCQLCGHTILLPDGLRYAEAHHIRPLGEPHNGPDTMENILCLCPNHHAELDYRARVLQVNELSTVSSHPISEDHIHYHNEVICKCKSYG